MAVTVALAVSATAGSVRADDFEAPKKIEAATLWEEGRDLYQQGEYAKACGKWAASHKVEPNMSVLFRLGQCYEKAGRFASAYAAYTEVVGMARLARMKDREDYAQKAADAIRIKIQKILIIVPAEVASLKNLQIKLDGEPIAKESFGVGLPSDSGSHTIAVTAPNRREWSTTVTVGSADASTVTVSIPLLAEEPNVTPVPSATATAGAPASGWSGMKIAGAVTAGAGAVTLVVGGVLGGLAISKNSEANSFCRSDEPTLCTAQGVALGQETKSLGTASTGLFIGGGVLAAGGVLMFLLAPSGSSTPVKSGSSLRVRVSGSQLAVEGSW